MIRSANKFWEKTIISRHTYGKLMTQLLVVHPDSVVMPE